ncbi:hypothetical protein PROPEN_02889 [Proteus penneri ATCC 35198]|nr:hypothetical protein PROPEN_02889 [Proteus penneri ATCC 35198]
MKEKISIIESKIENAKDLKFNENKSKDKIASIGESSINLNIGENSNEVNIDNEGGGQSNIIFLKVIWMTSTLMIIKI